MIWIISVSGQLIVLCTQAMPLYKEITAKVLYSFRCLIFIFAD